MYVYKYIIKNINSAYGGQSEKKHNNKTKIYVYTFIHTYICIYT